MAPSMETHSFATHVISYPIMRAISKTSLYLIVPLASLLVMFWVVVCSSSGRIRFISLTMSVMVQPLRAMYDLISFRISFLA